jgi:hypothetical protein
MRNWICSTLLFWSGWVGAAGILKVNMGRQV